MFLNLFKWVGFKYSGKSGSTPFETFLKYSDEKKKSSAVLSSILKNQIKKNNFSILDIGSGNGDYIIQSLLKAKINHTIELTLLEPASALFKSLQKNVSSLPNTVLTKLVNRTWQSFNPIKRFDLILASHLYHIPKDKDYENYSKMINFLNDGGILVLVLREKDDFYNLKKKYGTMLFGKDFNPKCIEESIKTFDRLKAEGSKISSKLLQSRSTLRIPLETNYSDAISILEFILDIEWRKIKPEIQNQILGDIKARKYVLNLVDGIAVIRRSVK